VLKVTPQVATPGAESAVYDSLVLGMKAFVCFFATASKSRLSQRMAIKMCVACCYILYTGTHCSLFQNN